MPNRKKRARRRQGGAWTLLYALIVLLALVALALILLLVSSDPFAAQREDELPYAYSDSLRFGDAQSDSPEPLVVGNVATPAPTQNAPSETAAPEETAAPAQSAAEASPEASGSPEDSASPEESGSPEASASPEPAATNRLIPTPPPGEYFLPVFDRALRTPDDQAMIAITVDGCDNPDRMTQILRIAEKYNAKLTLFPTGNALMRLAPGFRTCVNNLDYEVENTTFDTDKRDYALSNGELALQIWRQSIAASYAMTRDYQQHFYRPSMPESARDQRTHFFIRKLGFLGIAGYTYSYKGHDLDFLVHSLANGNIYQFDMSEESLNLFDSFLGEANRKGYKLVTMNELFGLDKNAVSRSLTIDQQTLPGMDDYVPTYYDLKLNDRSNAVYMLQARLMGLGYLTAEPGKSLTADGIYGGDTSVAVSAFQARVGLVGTGNADVETQEKLYSPDAPYAFQ